MTLRKILEECYKDDGFSTFDYEKAHQQILALIPKKKYRCGGGHEDIECDETNCETCKYHNEEENFDYNQALREMEQSMTGER